MRHKIAILTTDFLADYIRSALTQLNLNCSYQIFTYTKFEDIPEILPNIPKNISGILTSGSFPAQVVRILSPDAPYIIMPFNTDDQSIFQLFLRLLDENRKLDFDRISADVVSIHDVDLRSYLTKGVPYSLAANADQVVDEMTLDELYEIENKYFHLHLNAWQKNDIDLCVTRFSSLVEPLKKKGVKVFFPYPSILYIRDVCMNLLHEIEYREMQNNCPASIMISIAPPTDANELHVFSSEHHILILQTYLMEFLGDDALEFMFKRTDYTLKILTHHKNVHELTKNALICRIQNFLRQKSVQHYSIGYGLGWDLDHARANAIRALQNAEQQPDGASFLVNEKNELIGPLLTTDRLDASASLTKKKTFSISREKKSEMISVMKTFIDGEFTSQDLADKIQITKRSANRILSAMLNENLIEIAKTRPTASKGRPERIYKLSK